MELFQIIFLSVLLISAAIFDLRSQKIPNILTYSSILITMTYHLIINGIEGLLFSAGGIGLGIGLLILPYLMGGMGAGDAKLMGAIGGMLGAKSVFYAFLLTAAVGGIYALVLIVVYRSSFRGFIRKQFSALVGFMLNGKYRPDSNSEKNVPKLCYGLSIALGTGLYLFLTINGYEFLR